MEKKYTEEDIIELIKLYDSTLQVVQTHISNIRTLLAINNRKSLINELNRLDNYLYKYRLYNQEDIKKSESDTCNNNSL
mgnify:CR=1 FL=1